MSFSSSSVSLRALLALCAVAMLALCVKVTAANADAFGPQFPISSTNHPSEGLQAAFQDQVFNERTGQYLVVYVAATTVETDDIYGQFVDVNGNLVGQEFRISDTSAEHSEYNPPTVGYDSDTGRYLVAWDRDETVYVRVLEPNGVPRTAELPISPEQSDIETEAIAYSPVTHEYLVVWKAFNDGRVYTQRLNQDGVQVGGDDVIVGGSPTLTVDDAVDVAYNATSLEYMIVFRADPGTGGEEIYGQRLNLAGSEVGLDDFKISDMGPPGDESGSFNAAPPSVVWNSTLNQYLVGWHGNEGVAPLASSEREVFGQLLAADGTQIGADDFRISDMGVDGDTKSAAFRPRLAYDPFGNQYLVTWHGDDLVPPLIDEEFEVYGQYLAADGTQIGTNDFRISEVLPDGNVEFAASRPAVAYNPLTCNYLVTYTSGNPNESAEIDSAVFGRRVAGSICPDRTAPVISGFKVTPNAISSGVKLKPRRKASAKASKKAPKKQAKARYTLSEPAAVTFTVERKLRGKLVGGKCRKLKKGAKPAGKRCALWVKTGKKLKQSGFAGANVKSFTAKSIRRKGLKPGAYRIAAVATDAAGNASTQALAKFKVIQPR